MEHAFNKIIDLLFLARQKGVEVMLNDERLQLKTGENVEIDEQLLNEIRSNKQSIIDYLSGNDWKAVAVNGHHKKIDRFDRASILHIPLSFSQERLWFIDRLEGSVQYHSPAVMRLAGNLDKDALLYSLRTIIQRHEVLRTVFYEIDGKVYQSIKEDENWQLQFNDGSRFKEDAGALKLHIEKFFKEPFNLASDYPIRGSLIQLGEQESVLVVTMHHIASDAWSASIIVNEVAELYNSFIQGRKAGLAPLPIQYADFAVWQRNYLQGAVLDKKLSYWQRKLQGASPLQLPSDYSRPAVKSTRGASAGFRIDKKITDQLHELSRHQGVSLFMLLLATFKVLLHRYSHQEDISVGTSIASRQQKELEGLVGFFVNTLALRTEFSSDISFTDLLEKVKATTLEAYEHQDVPFEKVVEVAGNERDASRNPLFQVMLVLQNTPESPKLKLGEVELSGEPVVTGVAKFDMTFFINETPNGFLCSVDYNIDLYNDATIRRMTDHFTNLLSAVVKNPQQKIGLLRMLSIKEEQQLLMQFNDAEVAYPKNKSIVELFEEQVAKTPQHIALVFENEEMSYQELNERSNRLAHYLKNRDVRPETLIPLYIERSALMIVGLLGIMKAGAAYIPFDTDLPAGRISYMLEDADATIIVSSNAAGARLQVGVGVEIIALEDTVISHQPSGNLPLKPSATDLAYIIYTSGSTGRPKGAMIEHRNLVDYYYGLNKYIQIDQCRSFALVSTIATDLGNTVIYGSLLSGGSLHVFSKESVSNMEYLHRYFREAQIECVKIVPSHWKALSTRDELLLPAKLLIFGGEALPSENVADIRRSGSSCRVVNHYGPTETTIGKLLHQVAPESSYEKRIPIGKPFSNTSIYVLSKDMQLCPIGIPGQLYIAGDGVGRGYCNNTELTAEKFVKDPFSAGTESSSKMYGTGDLVKWLPDGNIEFIGRVDDQVQIRGYRVEPGEIEIVLTQSSLVKQAVVLARADRQGNPGLVAYIVANEEFDKEGIIIYLKKKLPEYMIPGVLIEMEHLPLTANGKTDRKALPDPDIADRQVEKYVGPRNETEEKMAAIWVEVLEVEQVGVHDDFFDLGGHSLLAVRLISAIRKAFNVEMPIGDIFDYPTVALLSAQLSNQSEVAVMPSVERVYPRPEHIPLSFSQERLWFIDQLGGSLQYHVPVVLRLKGKLHKTALAFAIRSIVDRHEVLRTVYRQRDGQPYQVIQDAAGWDLAISDGSEYKQDGERLQNEIQQIVFTPFNLSKDHLIRGHLISFDDEEHVLVVVIHHIASDGWSKSILVKEVVEGYSSYEEGRPLNLPALPVQYADFAIWQRNYVHGEILEKKLEYWNEKLHEVATLDLPTNYSRPKVQSARGALTGFHIDTSLLNQLHELSTKQGVTLFMTLLSAFKVLLYRYSGQQDICVGTPIAGRQQQELEGLIGFFVNTLALRSEISGDASFTDLLQQVKATTLEAYEHQEIPFERVVDSVVKERDLSRNPLFQVMFVLRNTPDVPELNLGGVQVSREAHKYTTTLFDLTLFITESNYGLRCLIEYNTDLYNEAMIVRMSAHFKELLCSIVKSPKQTISLLTLLTGAGEQQLLTEFNTTLVAYPQHKTVAGLFVEQALRTPAHTAIIFEGKSLTYQELDERSNQLAHYLRSKGVKEETLVPICVERSIDMITGILAILKAGATYVPVDPQYPAVRIRYILEETAAHIIISTGRSSPRIEAIATVDIIETDNDWRMICGQSTTNPNITTEPHHLAYVIYTSGSTGTPKGVQMPGSNLVNLLYWQEQQFSSSHRRHVLQFASLSFDVSFQEIFSTLCFGSTLYLINEERRKDMAEIVRDIDQYRLTHLFIPYIVLKSLAEYVRPLSRDALSLQEIIVAGEQLKLTEEITALLEKNSIQLVNQYGPTEAHVVSSYVVTKKDYQHALPPIGKPVANVQLYVLSSSSKGLCPIGVPGELYIGGAQVAAGYLNKGALTKEKFVENTFDKQGKQGKESRSKMYRTGDLVRWQADGNLEYLGRIDEQVKIRGYRVELGEIESVLEQHEQVSRAVVVAKEDSSGSKRLVGYVVAAGEEKGTFAREAITSYLKDRLPEYMIPGLWVVLERLPVSPNGKIDRRALPDPDLSTATGHQYVAPGTELEQQLALIWQELLGVEKVGIHDNFFELGGHSLLVMRVVSAVRKKLNVELFIKDLFVHPTIAALAGHLATQSKGLLLPALEVQPRPRHIPLSFSQERLWFIDRLGGSLQYHLPAVLKLKGRLEKEALSNAFRQIVNRHQVLRTIVREEEGLSFQYIKEKDAWEMQVVDGSFYREDSSSLQEYVKQLIDHPFHLSDDYMLRVTLISLAEEDHILIATLHHIASDGWSTSIMVTELVELYNAYTARRTASLALLPVQYADYAIWQRKYLQGEAWDKKLQYWKEKLQGVAALQLLADYPRSLVQSTNGAVTNFRINTVLSDQLQALSQQQGTTLFMTLLAAYNVLLYRYSGQQDICVGTPIAGRQQQELEGLIGYFANTLALRCEVNGSASFTDLLQQIKVTTLEAYDHQEIPFEKVVEAVVKERDMSRSPLFQVMLVLQNTPDIQNLQLGQLQVSSGIAGLLTHTISKYDLIFAFTETLEGLYLSVEYCIDLYNGDTVKKMIAHFNELLISVVKSPEQKVGHLRMLDDAEQQILLKFNNTVSDYPSSKTIVGLFEEQVTKTPDKIAILFENEKLTYRQLNERSNQLARYLQKTGVKADMPVPIIIEKSIEMMIGVLGILKAGGAYVPIDPEYPEARINLMLEDTSAGVVVCSSTTRSRLTSSYNIDIIDISSNSNIISQQPDQNLRTVVKPSNLANIIYTSGSAGMPKGVMVTHKNVVSLVKGVDYVSLTSRDILLSTGSFSFDATTFEYWSMLLNGGVLIVCSDDKLLDTGLLKQEIKTHKVNLMWFTSGWFNQLVDSDITVFETLKTIIAGGEKLSEYHIGVFRKMYPHINVINGYGPTENTTFSLTYPIKQTTTGHSIPVGRSLNNRSAIIIDENDQLVPVGVSGEICLGGAGLSKGYLNHPQLTAEKFIDHPFSKLPGEKIYKSGDIGSLLPDGNILYLGRKDEQVKIRGYRIEPGEIESQLQESGMVNNAVVMARSNSKGDKNLIGYIIPGNLYEKQSLIFWLQDKLPSYMIPAVWVELDHFPLSPNGKIDKAALPDPDSSGLSHHQYAAPENEFEIKIAEIWQQLLEVEKIGIHDNFFDIGGHSFLAIRLVWQIRKEMEIDIPINDIFIYPTIAGLAANMVSKVQNPLLPDVNIKYLVPIKTTGYKPPLYLVAGGGGTALKIKKFADLLDAGQPVYVFQPPVGGNDLKEFPDTIEGIAAIFIEEMLLQNPKGPYALSGHCIGGIIAFEMAKQLQLAGKKVHSLAMFDTIIRKKAEIQPGTLENLFHIPSVIQKSFSRLLFKVHFQTFLLRNHASQSIRYKVNNFRTMRNKSKLKKLTTDYLEYAGLEIFNESSDIYIAASKKYVLVPYEGQIILFYAKEHYFFLDKVKNISYKRIYLDEKTKNIWKDYAAGISIYEIKGEHSDIFDPVHGEEFAQILQKHLDNS